MIVAGTEVSILRFHDDDYISLTDMLKAKDGEFFFSNWLRNRNTIEFLGIWEKVNNPEFNCAEFDIIKSKAGLNSYRLSAKEWMQQTNMPQPERLQKLNQIAIQQMSVLTEVDGRHLLK